MKCKNCDHRIIYEDGRWQHYPTKGDLDLGRYVTDVCYCGCEKAESKDSKVLESENHSHRKEDKNES